MKRVSLANRPIDLPSFPHFVRQLSLVLALIVAPFGYAEDDEEGDEVAPTTKYFELEPEMVTNFGGPGRLRYMKVGVTLRVKGDEGEAQAMHHLPSIKDSLLTLFAVQTSDTLRAAEGKEELRKAALEKVNTVLAGEDDESHVEDLLFTSFVAHH